MSKKIEKWKVLGSEPIYRSGYVSFRKDKCQLPDGRIMPSYHVVEFPEWVNVVPITEDGKMVLVEQYRHALGSVSLEIPGGSMDPKDDDPKKAALRELQEETGFTPDDIRLIGRHAPNPAVQSNWQNTYIAYNCRKTGDLQLDAFEDLKVVVMPIPEVYEAIRDGRINHTIVIASLFYALPILGMKA